MTVYVLSRKLQIYQDLKTIELRISTKFESIEVMFIFFMNCLKIRDPLFLSADFARN